MNACKKGKAGERELAHFLIDHGIAAKRGQQHAGGVDSPDVKTELDDDWHFECKRVQSLNVHEAFKQADRDRDKGKRPIVAFRRNHGEWMACIRLTDFLAMVRTEEQKALAALYE